MSFVNVAMQLKMLESSGQGGSDAASNAREILANTARDFIEERRIKILKLESEVRHFEEVINKMLRPSENGLDL